MNSLLLLIACAFVVDACSAQTSTRDVSNEQAAQLISSKPELQIVDVRQKWEVEQGMIPNALHIDISKPDFEANIAKLDKSKPVLVYCAAGGRSQSAEEYLIESGFTEVYDLSGGYENWPKK